MKAFSRPGPDLLAAGVVVGALGLLLPLEWSLADALGLPLWARWTPSAIVEGFTALAIATRMLVPWALALTWSSALAGMAHSATERARADGRPVDRLQAGLVVAEVTVCVAALAGTHVVRLRRARVERIEQARLAEIEQADAERARQAALEQAERDEAERARDRAHAEQQEKARLQAETDQARARSYADQERSRAYAEQERARLEHERTLAEIALERARLDAQQTAPIPLPGRAPRNRRPAPDDITTRRVRAEWERAEHEGTPWTGAALGEALGITETAARKIALKWRDKSVRADEAAR